MIIVLDSVGRILATHDDGQIKLVIAASDYAGLAIASVADASGAGLGDLAPQGSIVLRPAGGVYVPQSITRLQFVRQSKSLGIWTNVQAYIVANPDVQDWWDYASAIERHSPVLIAAATAFEMSSAQIDEFFIAGAQLA